MEKRPKTIFCDIDGTIVKHHGTLSEQLTKPLELLPNTLSVMNEWEMSGCKIILVTGRKECMRVVTEKQLADAGIFYDQLIMGIGGGQRVLINDNKPDGTESAFAIKISRNVGVENLDINNL